ncbi:hypothetical protein Tco_0227162 [Tanacetum coccineum]
MSSSSPSSSSSQPHYLHPAVTPPSPPLSHPHHQGCVWVRLDLGGVDVAGSGGGGGAPVGIVGGCSAADIGGVAAGIGGDADIDGGGVGECWVATVCRHIYVVILSLDFEHESKQCIVLGRSKKISEEQAAPPPAAEAQPKEEAAPVGLMREAKTEGYDVVKIICVLLNSVLYNVITVKATRILAGHHKFVFATMAVSQTDCVLYEWIIIVAVVVDDTFELMLGLLMLKSRLVAFGYACFGYSRAAYLLLIVVGENIPHLGALGKLIKLAAMRDLCGFAIKNFRIRLRLSCWYHWVAMMTSISNGALSHGVPSWRGNLIIHVVAAVSVPEYIVLFLSLSLAEYSCKMLIYDLIIVYIVTLASDGRFVKIVMRSGFADEHLVTANADTPNDALTARNILGKP